MAGSVALVLVVQSVATYTSLVPIVRSVAGPVITPTTAYRSPQVTGVSIDNQNGFATLTMTPFTSQSGASALGAKYGMQLLTDFPAFGRYIFSLPQIRIGPGPAQHTATIYFPPYATAGDINTYLTRNGLAVQTWVSTDDTAGRTAVVTLPQIMPVLIDAQNGIWQAWVGAGIDRSRIDAWAATNGLQIISYDSRTGELRIQGPKPKPVLIRTVIHKPAPVVTTTTNTTPQTSKLYIAFKPGTTFTQAQSAIQSAGGQVTSFDSSTELAVATVPVGQESQATGSLNASPQVSCVGASSTACPAAQSSTTTPASTTTTPAACDPAATTCPAASVPDTTASGTGWTTTVVPAPATTPAPPQLQAVPTDGHVGLTWSAVDGATGYQVYRSSGTDTPALVATTTATTLTDVGGAAGTVYAYSIVPVLTSGPATAQAQTASATWAATTSSPMILGAQPSSGSLSGSVALSVDGRTGDGVGTVTWQIVKQDGTVTNIGTATGASQSTDPLTWSARMVWDSRTASDASYTLVVTVTDGSAHTSQTASPVRIGNAAPAAPTALGAAPVGSSVVLTWRQPAVANGAAYLVQKDADIEPAATVATGALSWTDDSATPGEHTYKVVLEDRYGNVSSAATVTAAAVAGTRPAAIPSLALKLPSGDAVAPDGAVDDRLLLVSDATAGSGVTFQYAIDGAAWQDVQGTMSCAPGCTVDWNVGALARGHYSVRAVTAVGTGLAKGFTVRGDGGLPAPNAPSALITPFGVQLQWSPTQGELPSRYAISRLDGNTWVVLDRVTGTQFVDRTAQPGKNQYRVQAYNSDGAAGQASPTTSITVPDVARPSGSAVVAQSLVAPTGVQAVSGPGSVTLMWTAVAQASGYVVARAWQQAGPFETVGSTGATIFRDTASVGAVAYYRVHAFSGNQDGDPSAVVSAALVPVSQPAASTSFVVATGGPAATTQAPGALTLGTTQSTASGGTTVNVVASGQGAGTISSVQVQTLSQGTWSVIGELPAVVDGQRWTASGAITTTLLSEGAHQVRAAAMAPNGSVVSATIASTLNVVHTAAVVTGVSSTVSGNSVRVSWNGGAAATYNVYRSTTGANSFALAATGVTGSSFLDSSLAGAQLTGYVVTQTDVYGNESDFSQVQWITTPVAWNLTAPDLSILTPNAAERPDQAIVDLAAQVSSVSGIASLQFAFAPLGSGLWTSILNTLPIKPGSPVTPSGPGLAAAGVATWGTSLNTTGMAAGRYDFRVIATDASGRTAQKLDTFDVGAAGARGPPTPGFTLNSTATSTGVQLTWTGAAGDLFQVRRAFGSGSIFTSLGTTSASQFVDTSVLPGSNYQYQVVRLSPSIAYTAIQGATAVSSFNAGGKATSSDGKVVVGVQSASSDKLAVAIGPDTAPPAMSTGLTAVGSVYDVNATSLASGAPVHRLDQPATLTFALPAGTTQAQAQAMSVFHWDATSQTWVRESTTLDWPNRQLIATVNHFSFFTIGTTCDGVLNYLCWTDAAAAVVSLKEPTGLATLFVSDSGLALQFSYSLLGITIASGSLATARTAMTSLIINAGKSNVEINGNLDSLPGTLEIDGSTIKVDPGFAVSATGAVNFNAIYQSNGHSLLGITTTILGVNASIDINGATLSGSAIDLEALAGTLSTTVNPGGDSLAVGTLHVASTFGFDSTGAFTVDGGTGTCSYTGTSADGLSFTGITGCTGTPANGASVRSNLTENGSGTGINHAGLQLIYQASINVHGASTITASSGGVKLNSVTDVIASANAAGGADMGAWSSGNPYHKGDIVTFNNKRYAALNDVTSATNPASDSTNWKDAKASDSSVTIAQVLANATSQLSGTSSISAPGGDVSILSNLKTNITSKADSTGAGSGAGIAIAVLTTDSEAFVDSTNATPINSKNLTLSADSNNSAPTTAKESPGAATGNDTGQDANSNSSRLDSSKPGYNAGAAGQADGKSKTGDGSQGLAGALAVTVLVETTKAYIAPASGAVSINTSGSDKIHAGATNNTSAIADAGNVQFTPDAPTFTADSTVGGFLNGGTTYYYRVTALTTGDNSTTQSGANPDLSGGVLNVTSTAGFDSTGVLTVAGIGMACSYSIASLNQFNVTNCSGVPSLGAAVTSANESLPGPEASHKIPGSSSNSQVTVNWTAVVNAIGYRIYRSDTAGKEFLLDSVLGTTSYHDNTVAIPPTSGDLPTTDAKSGFGERRCDQHARLSRRQHDPDGAGWPHRRGR
jgi:hypothetical protein